MEMIGAFDPVVLVDMHRPAIGELISRVAHATHVSEGLLHSRNREQHVALARMIAMYLIYSSMGLSWVQIGRIFHRDHSTVIHASRLIGHRMELESQFRAFVNGILQP